MVSTPTVPGTSEPDIGGPFKRTCGTGSGMDLPTSAGGGPNLSCHYGVISVVDGDEFVPLTVIPANPDGNCAKGLTEISQGSCMVAALPNGNCRSGYSLLAMNVGVCKPTEQPYPISPGQECGPGYKASRSNDFCNPTYDRKVSTSTPLPLTPPTTPLPPTATAPTPTAPPTTAPTPTAPPATAPTPPATAPTPVPSPIACLDGTVFDPTSNECDSETGECPQGEVRGESGFCARMPEACPPGTYIDEDPLCIPCPTSGQIPDKCIKSADTQLQSGRTLTRSSSSIYIVSSSSTELPDLNVVVNVTNDDGGNKKPSDFVIRVNGTLNNPTPPLLFAGLPDPGTNIIFASPGTYDIVVANGDSNYDEKFFGDCKDKLVTKTTRPLVLKCTIVLDDKRPTT